MILRRRGETFASVICEHLGGALFATEHPVERYFQHKTYSLTVSISLKDLIAERVKLRVEEHIRTAPERERAALRRANIWQACHASHLKG